MCENISAKRWLANCNLSSKFVEIHVNEWVLFTLYSKTLAKIGKCKYNVCIIFNNITIRPLKNSLNLLTVECWYGSYPNVGYHWLIPFHSCGYTDYKKATTTSTSNTFCFIWVVICTRIKYRSCGQVNY